MALNVYESWGKLGTISVTSRTGIVSATYKKGDIKDIYLFIYWAKKLKVVHFALKLVHIVSRG